MSTTLKVTMHFWLRNAGLSLVYSALLLVVFCLGELFASTRFESQFQSSAEYAAQKHLLLRGERVRGILTEFAEHGFHSAPPGSSQPEVLERLQKRYPNEFDAKKVVWSLKDDESAFFYKLVPNWLAVLFFLLLLASSLLVALRPFAIRSTSSYVAMGRLADVLALIQALAFDRDAHRSEAGLQTELQGKPTSGASWNEVARAHPELFRVKASGTNTVSLIARHVEARTEGQREPLSIEHGSKLLTLAVELHDRERDRAHGWQAWLPVIVALLAGVFTLVGAGLSK